MPNCNPLWKKKVIYNFFTRTLFSTKNLSNTMWEDHEKEKRHKIKTKMNLDGFLSGVNKFMSIFIRYEKNSIQL